MASTVRSVAQTIEEATTLPSCCFNPRDPPAREPPGFPDLGVNTRTQPAVSISIMAKQSPVVRKGPHQSSLQRLKPVGLLPDATKPFRRSRATLPSPQPHLRGGRSTSQWRRDGSAGP